MKKNKKTLNIISYITSIILILSSVILMVSTKVMNVLYNKYFFGIFILLLLVDILIISIIINKKKSNLKRILNIIISNIFSIIMIGLIIYILSTIGFVKNITGKSYEKQIYSVLTLKNSSYNKIKDLNNETIGFIDSTNNISKVKKTLENKANIKFYSNDEDLSNLIVDLSNKDLDAIVIDSERISLLEESQEEFIENTKVIYSFEVLVNKNKKTSNLDVVNNPFILYISGSDSRLDISSTARSDVNIVAVVNPNTNKILLVSIPRDYYVQLHDTTGVKDKLTHAGIYGVDMSKSTIEDLLDIDINYYLKVGFTSVIKSVDIIGGIDIYSDTKFTAHTNKKCNFIVGEQHLDGNCALAYSRERYAYTSGDRHRGENQQQVIEAILKKLNNPAILVKYNEILKSLDGSFETDMSYNEITNLIKRELNALSKWEVESISLDGTGSSMPTYSMGSQKLYVMLPDESTINSAKTKINEYLK